MRVSRIINLRNPQLLSLPWSEQRAKKERRKCRKEAKKETKTINFFFFVSLNKLVYLCFLVK